ncbi:MAG TPA: hypothetical protein VNG71_03740 [Pyrinomonadaceae bacterium]|nr:hypothetical protein [Pyrinomonadaceae bacterium]
MSTPNPKLDRQGPDKKVKDLPGCIKYFLLLLLLLLLFAEIYAGEFRRFPDWPYYIWAILLIKLILIAVLIWLIKVQKDLKCQITAPANGSCVKEESDIPSGKVFVRIKGTASGAAFGHYTLEVTLDGDPPIAGIVTYPAGGGGVQVTNGELGQINTASLVDGAYTVTLRVFPAGAGASKVCTTTFNLLKVMVLISKVGKIPTITMVPTPNNHNPFDPLAELRKNYGTIPAPDNQLVAVGGSITMDGIAYIYGCAGRKITKYEIRYARVMALGGEPPQPPPLSAIPATWPIANRLELLEYSSPDHYKPWTRIGLAPRNLINSWDTFTIGGTTYFFLHDDTWNSGSVASGRYSLLLTAEDSIGAIFHDIQHVWLDNEPVFAMITGIANVNPCAELKLSDFSKGMQVLGIAWDRIIDAAFPPNIAPNDNFDAYGLTLYKQGGGHHAIPIASPNTRVIVPFRKAGADPTPAEAGVLADFDIISILDGGAVGSDPAVSIPRGTGCAYYFYLSVSDKTRLNDDTDVHSNWDIWPFCIVNDIK